MDKEIISAISAVAGWFGSQLYSFVKLKWAERKLKDGLLTELQDVKDILQRSVNIYGRSLQISAKQGIDPTTALPVPNMYFQHYFKQAFSSLNREQRISYQLIHALLDSLNKKNEELGKFFEERCNNLRYSTDDANDRKVRAEWKERITLLYKLTHEVLWHIVYHMRYPESPALEPVRNDYLAFLKELEAKVVAINEGAKTIPRQEFEKDCD